ncbi:hypothetical protein GCM10023080_096650 [Streptomyces pseudoechinosporeus]
MHLGLFGSVFLLTQYFQDVGGYSSMEAGMRMLPWTAIPMIAGPLAGALSDRIGGRPVVAVGLVLFAAGVLGVAAVLVFLVPSRRKTGGPAADLTPGDTPAGVPATI